MARKVGEYKTNIRDLISLASGGTINIPDEEDLTKWGLDQMGKTFGSEDDNGTEEKVKDKLDKTLLGEIDNISKDQEAEKAYEEFANKNNPITIRICFIFSKKRKFIGILPEFLRTVVLIII